MAQSELAQRLLAGDRRALARAITLVQDDDPAGWELVREVYRHMGKAAVVGFTGPPGAGKSTLIGALTRRRRALGRQIGVLSIDPPRRSPAAPCSGTASACPSTSSTWGLHPFDGHPRGARRTRRGGASGNAADGGGGREEIYVETVGVGQAEVDIAGHADSIVPCSCRVPATRCRR